MLRTIAAQPGVGRLIAGLLTVLSIRMSSGGINHLLTAISKRYAVSRTALLRNLVGGVVAICTFIECGRAYANRNECEYPSAGHRKALPAPAKAPPLSATQRAGAQGVPATEGPAASAASAGQRGRGSRPLGEQGSTTSQAYDPRRTGLRAVSGARRLESPAAASAEPSAAPVLRLRKLVLPRPCERASRIFDWLYIGGEEAATDAVYLQFLGIQRVVNCCERIPFASQSTANLQLRMRDVPKELLSSHLPSAFDFLDEAKEAGETVLVHCRSGASRSVAVVLAFMIVHERVRLADAWTHVRARRSVARPNRGFMEQLLQYDRIRNGPSALTLPELLAARKGYALAAADPLAVSAGEGCDARARAAAKRPPSSRRLSRCLSDAQFFQTVALLATGGSAPASTTCGA